MREEQYSPYTACLRGVLVTNGADHIKSEHCMVATRIGYITQRITVLQDFVILKYQASEDFPRHGRYPRASNGPGDGEAGLDAHIQIPTIIPVQG